MKFLQSRGIVIVLAVVALALVFNNLVRPMFGRRVSARTVSKTTPEPARPGAVSATAQVLSKVLPARTQDRTNSITPVAPQNLPDAPMNVQEMTGAAPKWVSSPQRDPFKVRNGVRDGKSAREQLTLTGTLRQTGGTLAVLNNRVLGVGDSILGFTIETVESDRVWVNGPNGKEMIEFKYSVTTAQTKPTQAPQETAAAGSPGTVKSVRVSQVTVTEGRNP